MAGRPLLAEPLDPMIGGMDVETWMTLYNACHEPSGFGGMRRVEWPSNGGLEEQPYVTIVAFTEITVALAKEAERNSAQRSS